MSEDIAFRLSRIEAQGWNTVRRFMLDQTKRPDDDRIAELTPSLPIRNEHGGTRLSKRAECDGNPLISRQ